MSWEGLRINFVHNPLSKNKRAQSTDAALQPVISLQSRTYLVSCTHVHAYAEYIK